MTCLVYVDRARNLTSKAGLRKVKRLTCRETPTICRTRASVRKFLYRLAEVLGLAVPAGAETIKGGWRDFSEAVSLYLVQFCPVPG